jgi:hypothetical protein
MLIKDPIVQATIALLAVQNVLVMQENFAMRKKLKSNYAEFRYIAHLLNTNDIVLDEFDLIALPSFKRKEISSQ